MASGVTNQAITDGMRSRLRQAPQQKLAMAQVSPCDGFAVSDFEVTFPNGELIVTVQVTGVPSGVTLVGVTVAAAPDPTSHVTYCMGMAADNAGLALPVSVVGASTLPTFPGQTTVTGFVILSYVRAGSSEEQCVITQAFTVGG
jgi:hypothetical protein